MMQVIFDGREINEKDLDEATSGFNFDASDKKDFLQKYVRLEHIELHELGNHRHRISLDQKNYHYEEGKLSVDKFLEKCSPPIAFRLMGKLIFRDGNHRLNSAINRGHVKFAIYVISFPEEMEKIIYNEIV